MNFNEYELKTGKTAIYRGKDVTFTDVTILRASETESLELRTEALLLQALNYVTLGLVGEAGEIANKVKKISRDLHGEITEELKDAIAKELGDVLWYVARLSKHLGIPLNQVAKDNLANLQGRKERGTLTGDGDGR